MIAWVKRLLWDETAFVRYARAILLGGSIYLGSASDLPPWATALGAALAILIGAGERNPPTGR